MAERLNDHWDGRTTSKVARDRRRDVYGAGFYEQEEIASSN